jgi:hypothetical protein
MISVDCLILMSAKHPAGLGEWYSLNSLVVFEEIYRLAKEVWGEDLRRLLGG